MDLSRTRKVVLGIEASILLLVAGYAIGTLGPFTSSIFMNSAMVFIAGLPLAFTLAYYGGFMRTIYAGLASIILTPLATLTTFLVYINTFGTKLGPEGGLTVVFVLFLGIYLATVAPYVVFAWIPARKIYRLYSDKAEHQAAK